MTLDELAAEITQALRTDLARARRLVSEFARRARRSGEPLARALALFQRAKLDQAAGQNRRALQVYTEARAAFAGLGETGRAFQCDVGAVQVAALLGDPAATRAATRRLRRAAEGPLQEAGAEIAIASARDALGDEAGAEEGLRRALETLRGRTEARAALVRATARSNLGVRLARRGALRQGLAELDSALSFYEEQAMAPVAGVVRHNRAWALGILGEAADALRELRRAREEFGARGDRRRAALAAVD